MQRPTKKEGIPTSKRIQDDIRAGRLGLAAHFGTTTERLCRKHGDRLFVNLKMKNGQVLTICSECLRDAMFNAEPPRPSSPLGAGLF
jgi:hypothetical protein